MAKIPLRVYTKEIEKQIDRGEIDPAIAHARNILKSYPKHIDTYRLLGKAYLEAQRYSEASDILQRVLSVIPDDFVAQIGMSIIREDEGNLDAAIWHMERAYEVQPFNPAVQEELRRLYGRRDGVEPPKIRLTRGALVRMYTRGGLFQQAIAETRAALADDPQRFDLLVLLARLYNLTNQKIEATEVCSTLISKLPFCYEANLILSEILPGTSRAEDARKFQQRIYALDPYAAFVSPGAPSSDQVPDQAVMVEQFNWEAALEIAQAPEWAQTIGVEWEETEEEALPDWINALKPDTPQAVAPDADADAAPVDIVSRPETTQEEAGELHPPEELIPDWMKAAGWTAADRRAEEIMAEQEESGEEEIAPAEIPDWLQSIAPAGALEDTGEEAGPDSWLESLAGQPLAPEGGLEKRERELPDWMADIQQEETGADELNLSAPAGWVQAGEEPAPETPAGPAETLDWLASFDEEPAETGTPEWLPASTSEPEIEQPQAGTPDLSDMDATMAWLEALAARQGADEETLTISAEQRRDEMPDWIKQELEVSGEEPAAEELPAAEASPEEAVIHPVTELPAVEEQLAAVELPEAAELSTDETGLPDWLQAFGAEEAGPEAGEPGIPESEMTGEAPSAAEPSALPFDMNDEDAAMAWLESLAARQGADEETLVTPPEQRAEAPDWVQREVEAEAAVPEPAAGLEGATELSMPEAEMPDLSDMDATMAWLETLAARQGAEEETLVTPVEQRTETPPDWIRQEFEKVQPAAEEDLPEVEELPALEKSPEAEELSAAGAMSAWLQQMTSRHGEQPQREEPAAEASPPGEQPLPDWLGELGIGARAEAPAEPAEPAVEEQPSSAQLAEAVQPPAGEFAGPIEAAAAAEELPAASELPAAEEQPGAEELPGAVEQPAAEGMDLDAAFAWLESLAAKQGAEEDTLITSAEDRLESPPDWIQEEQARADAALAELPEIEPDQVELPAAVDLPAAEGVEQLEELAYEAEGTLVSPVEEAPVPGSEEVPGWPSEIGAEQPDVEQPRQWGAAEDEITAVSEGFAPDEMPLPDWLQQAGGEENLPGVEESAGEIPDWLKDIPTEEEAAPLPGSEFQSAWQPETGLEEAAVRAEPAAETAAVMPASLVETRAALERGELDAALSGYSSFISSGEYLSEIIHDLRDALYRYPVDTAIWQALGDAYAQNNQLQEALDAYTKAEELLR